MMRIASASNILAAAETGDICPQSLLTSTREKRNHAEIGDGSQQSPPPPSPSEKRNRVEIVQQQPPKSSPPMGEEKLCKCEGIEEGEKMTFDKLPTDAKERYLKVKESFGPLWDELNMGSHYTSDEQIGDFGFLFPDQDPEPNQNSPVNQMLHYT